MSHPAAYILLEDGTRFDGLACGAAGHAVGEIVFTTSMSGYQEAMTDPSYAGQLIAFLRPPQLGVPPRQLLLYADNAHGQCVGGHAANASDDEPAPLAAL